MTTYRNLGQVTPAATTPTSLYTASTPVIVSTLAVCNRAATAATFRFAHRLAGATLSNEMYIFFDNALPANSTGLFTLGICLANTDILTVYASTSTVSFQAWGVESP